MDSLVAGGVSRPNPAQTMNVMIGGVEHTFRVNTEHLRGTNTMGQDMPKTPEMLGAMGEPVLDSRPITLPIVSEESQPRQR